MSVVYNCDDFAFISHEQFINELYSNVVIDKNVTKSYSMKKELFYINKPYKITYEAKKRKYSEASACPEYEQLLVEVNCVKELFKRFQLQFVFNEDRIDDETNIDAVTAANDAYNKCHQDLITNAQGGNTRNEAVVAKINNSNYLIPNNCHFYCNDVIKMSKLLSDYKYDLILLDPPWWNKFIRRKKLKTGQAYKMIYDTEIKELPIERLINNNGLVVVWCTNSPQHFSFLKNEIFPKWNINFIGKWYWLKVTKSLEPICSFSFPPGKQPFEQIVFGSTKGSYLNIESKLIVSIPSAIHSHKPPLTELLMPLLPENPKCLEIFARYLLPNWTSYGLEAIKFQHESLFVETV